MTIHSGSCRNRAPSGLEKGLRYWTWKIHSLYRSQEKWGFGKAAVSGACLLTKVSVRRTSTVILFCVSQNDCKLQTFFDFPKLNTT